VAVLPVLVTGSNVPQEFKGMHDQVTPESVASPATTAVSVVVALVDIEVGAGGLRATDIKDVVFVRLKLAGVEAPETAAVTAYGPGIVLAVNTGDAAMPLPSVVIVAVLSPPAKVPPAPEVGAVNVTVTPLAGAPPELTHASMWAANVPPTEALCPDPLSTAIDTTGAAGGLVLLPPHAVSVEIMASTVSKRIDWRVFIARLPPVRLW